MGAPRLCFPLGGGGGGGGIGGGGTPNRLAMFTAANTISDSAIVQAAGAIQTLGTIVPGTGYASATSVALGGGSGSGATAAITVISSVIVTVSLLNPGSGYTVGDVLTIPGGVGGTVTVTSVVAQEDVSGHITGQRIGAGTNQPTLGIDSRLGGVVTGLFRNVGIVDLGGGNSSQWTTAIASLVTGSFSQTESVNGLGAGGFVRRLRSICRFDGSAIAIDAFNAPANTAVGTAVSSGCFNGTLRRWDSTDLSTNSTLIVYTGQMGAQSVSSAGPLHTFTTTSMTYDSGLVAFNANGTTTTVTGFTFGGSGFAPMTAHAVTDWLNFEARSITLSSGAPLSITNFYGVRLRAQSATGLTITNRWSGIFHEDFLGKSAFYGNLGVGNALDVGAGKVIASLTLTNAGAGATNGTYIEAALTGGSGTGATADIVVSGNVVTTLLLRNPGQGYVVGDTLSTAAIGGAGFVFTVASTASILRSDGTTVAARVGAGTTSPRLSLDAVNGAMITGSASMIETNYYTSYFNSNIGAFVGGTVTPSTIYRGVFVNPLINTTSMALTTAAGLISNPNYTDSTAGSITNLTGLSSLMYRSYPNDLSTGANLTGVQSILGTRAGVGSVTSGSFTFFTGNLFHTVAGHTITTLTWYDTASTTLTGNATTTYLLRGRAFSGAGTITNRWAISQEDPLAKSAFYGNVGVGNALDVGAGKVIGSLTLTNGGTGYTNNTYSQVALTTVTGTGSGATADIVVAGGIVTTVVLRAPGQGYAVGDTLSCASIGAGSNFLVTVATTASILRSDGTAVASRVGAGTTTPVSTLHSNGLLTVSTNEDCVAQFASSNIRVRAQQLITSQYLTNGVNQPPAGNSTINLQLAIVQRIDSSLLSGSVTSIGQYVQNTLVDCVSSNIFHWGGQLQALVQNTALTGKTINAVTGGYTFGGINNVGAACVVTTVRGLSTAAQVSSSTAAVAVTTMTAVDASLSMNNGAHTVTDAHLFDGSSNFATGTITNFYGVRLRVPTVAGTITNRYPISQEDTLGTNFVRAKTHFGAAVGTAAATTASIEVTAQGALNGDVRLNSANAVVDVSAASTNGVKFNNRGGAGITSTTQNWYEEGTYTPTLSAGWTATAGNFAGYWTRTGRLVTLTIQFTGGTTSGATGGATISTPVGLTPARNGAGSAVNSSGTALGNGVVVVTTAGTIINANAITSTTVDKTIVVQYEV